jgi:hypothetical protein
MNQADADRIKGAQHSNLQRHEKMCADCGKNPTCPQLLDVLWTSISPRHNDICRTCGRPGNDHEVRHIFTPADFLCLECAEKRLGRQLTLDDLQPCIGNYAHFVMQSRASRDK